MCLDELSTNDLEILSVNATDADADNNARITYTLLHPVAGFSIGASSGILYVNTSRVTRPNASASGAGSDSDSKHHPHHHYDPHNIQLSVVATDAGRPALSAVCSVRVHVNRAGSARPYFLQSHFRTTIAEDAPKGTTLLRLYPDLVAGAGAGTTSSATGGAAAAAATSSSTAAVAIGNSGVGFRIATGNEDGCFDVVQPGGAIVLVAPLDRERVDSYNLRIVRTEFAGSSASNSASSSSGTGITTAATSAALSDGVNVYITVEDANDNAPVFQRGVYEATISEATAPRYSIAQLIATDADLQSSPNSEVVYDITSGNVGRMFSIDLISGVLSVNNDLDYDAGPAEFNLVIRACDSALVRPKCSVCPFRVLLTDENDNEPQFPVLEYREFVGENEPVGTSVFQARATDLDRGRFGRLTYAIDQVPVAGVGDVDPWRWFRVDEQTGVVTTAAAFDYEQRQRYAFVVRATDAGNRASVARVRVDVESRDEFSPQFTERTYRFAVQTPAPAGWVVGVVRATDRDRGVDGRVVYQLSTAHAWFKINRTSGAVMVRRKMDAKAAAMLGDEQVGWDWRWWRDFHSGKTTKQANQ